MKTCPRCHKSYEDPNLNFCLDDGSPLEKTTFRDHEAPTAEFNAPATAIGSAPVYSAPSAAPQPRRSSGILPWVVGILGVLAIVCGTGIASLIYLGNRNSDDQARNNSRPVDTTTTRSPTPANTQPQGSVTRAQFDAIKTGMDRSEVERLMGSRGEEYYSGVGGGVSDVSVKWVGQNYKTILISYQNNKVTSKTQVGLD